MNINSHDYLDCFTVPAVSRSPSSYILRLFHGPDCFSLNPLHIQRYGQPMVLWRLTSLLCYCSLDVERVSTNVILYVSIVLCFRSQQRARCWLRRWVCQAWHPFSSDWKTPGATWTDGGGMCGAGVGSRQGGWLCDMCGPVLRLGWRLLVQFSVRKFSDLAKVTLKWFKIVFIFNRCHRP